MNSWLLIAAYMFGFASIACGAVTGIASHERKYGLMLLWFALTFVLLTVAMFLATRFGYSVASGY